MHDNAYGNNIADYGIKLGSVTIIFQNKIDNHIIKMDKCVQRNNCRILSNEVMFAFLFHLNIAALS